jgi:polyisoprenoid-binding protein YceI
MALPSLRPALALLGLLAVSARAETYTIDPDQSSVTFTAHLVGHAVPGTFGKFSGTVTFDPAHPERMAAEAKIEVASISTKKEARDHHLQTPDYFDAAKFAELTFHSRSAKAGPGGDLELTGDLTIKSTTKSVVLQVHPTGSRRWEGKTAVNRKDFGVTHDALSDRAIGDTVEVTLEIQAK